MDAVPLLSALIVAQRGVQDSHLIAEDLVQIGRHRRRQADFRYQQNGRAALASTACMADRYTAVLPEPVTP